MWRILSAVLATLVVALVTASVQLTWADAAALDRAGPAAPGWQPVEMAPEVPSVSPPPLPLRLVTAPAPRSPGPV